MAKDIRIGDVIKLTSGGPRMTVGYVNQGFIKASYFHNGEFKTVELNEDICVIVFRQEDK